MIISILIVPRIPCTHRMIDGNFARNGMQSTGHTHPSSFSNSVSNWIIIITTYVVGPGQFCHIIAGSVDALYLVGGGDKPLTAYLFGYLLPTLFGNIVGGVSLVAAFAHAQLIARLEPK